MKKVLLLSVLFVFLMVSLCVAKEKEVKFGGEHEKFTVISCDEGIIVKTKKLEFKIRNDGVIYKKIWKKVNDNEDPQPNMYYGIYPHDGTVFLTTGTATSAVLSITPSPKPDKDEITVETINGFSLKYSSAKEILEITKGESHIKIWSCGQMEVEKWEVIFQR